MADIQVVDGLIRVPRFIVDLDEPAESRWNEICDRYRHEFAAIEQQLEAMVVAELGSTKGAIIQSLASGFLGAATKLGRVYYGDELKGMATRLGMSVGRLTLLQLVYEASSCCTSIVLNTPEGHPVHIRTMDWEMDFLRPLTIEIDFHRGGALLYRTTTWAGYVGILTAVRPQAFSASVNFRVTGDGYWANAKKALASAWPIGFLLREVFESVDNFPAAVTALAASELIAPVYFTMCGTARNQGALITRDRTEEVQRWTLEENGTIVQPNMDHFDNDGDGILWSRQRRDLGRRGCKRLGDAGTVSAEKLFAMMSDHPILNELTIFATFMCPNTGVIETRLPDATVGFKPHEDVANPIERATCGRCQNRYTTTLNPTGLCAHTGDWHALYSDCSKLKCAWGLKSDIGKCHWSCCFSTLSDPRGPCPRSNSHVPREEAAGAGAE